MEEMRVSLYRGRCLAVEIEVLHVTLETFTKLFLHFFEAKRTSKKNCKNLFLQTDIPLEKLPSTYLPITSYLNMPRLPLVGRIGVMSYFRLVFQLLFAFFVMLTEPFVRLGIFLKFSHRSSILYIPFASIISSCYFDLSRETYALSASPSLAIDRV
jgi:hypothetical protein